MTKRDGGSERRILTGMIVDKQVLARIATKWEPNLFGSQWGNLIGGWCVDFFNEYEAPPKKEIEGLFEAWANDADEDTIKIVEKFLSGLSDEYEQLSSESNSDYVIDQAAKYFNRIKLKRLSESIKGDVTTGNIDNSIPHINCVMNNNQLTKEQSELAIALTKFYLTNMAQ